MVFFTNFRLLRWRCEASGEKYDEIDGSIVNSRVYQQSYFLPIINVFKAQVKFFNGCKCPNEGENSMLVNEFQVGFVKFIGITCRKIFLNLIYL